MSHPIITHYYGACLSSYFTYAFSYFTYVFSYFTYAFSYTSAPSLPSSSGLYSCLLR
jgi:hypothetical protein